MVYKYFKVNKVIAAALGLLENRQELSDGTVILNQKDLINSDGKSIEEKARLLGAEILTEKQAEIQINEMAVYPQIGNVMDIPESFPEDQIGSTGGNEKHQEEITEESEDLEEPTDQEEIVVNNPDQEEDNESGK